MILHTVTGKTERERGRTVEVKSTSVATSYAYEEGHTFTVSFTCQGADDLYRDPCVSVKMTMEEAEKHLHRLSEMVAHKKLPELSISGFKAKMNPSRILHSPQEGLEVFHVGVAEMTGTLSLSLTGWILRDSHGIAIARISS